MEFSDGRRTGKLVGVMFDWDGVLLDSLGASFNVYNKIFATIGSKRLTEDEFLRLQSPNWYEFYAKVGVPKPLWKQVDQDWVELYKKERPGLHSDALACLAKLRESGFGLALVSNGSRKRVEGELHKFGLAPFFKSIICGESAEELKPSPVMLERALEDLSLLPGRAAYVGDSPADIQAAKNARVPSIAIARGQIQEERLGAEDPDYVFGGLDEMTRFLLDGSRLP